MQLLFDGAGCTSPVELNGTAHFYDMIGTHDWFVNFYAPWCGHCKALEADWTALASQLAGSSTGVARVDATAHTELAVLYQVEGFPSLQFFSGGRVFSYAGERSLSAMLAFAEGGFKGDLLHAQPMPARPSWLDPLVGLPRAFRFVVGGVRVAKRSEGDRRVCDSLTDGETLVGQVDALQQMMQPLNTRLTTYKIAATKLKRF